MKFIFYERAWDEYLHWQNADRKLLGKLNAMIEACCRDPFSGIGKPEPLRGTLSGWWSRRLTIEHRLVYRLTEEGLHIISCRSHYE